ncbi:hypothetical protein [Cupriavidus consociatus]|uniref:hypothetical protein n=1 Tax=Cupriavidus consociatus TaxID=2821357 RepID=UPI001AEB4FFB|nr:MULTISPECIES: hypothetical protein [unclassified Cupriavidus]MBP0624131.1 hypothetical protein [Cupriavidus sp. LEh25]MDK2660843.1 hypothetical protein [Cupriavidus sp. LEh21]
MTHALKANTQKATQKSPKVIVRVSTATKAVVVTPAMKAKLQEAAKRSGRRTYPELPEWRTESSR